MMPGLNFLLFFVLVTFLGSQTTSYLQNTIIFASKGSLHRAHRANKVPAPALRGWLGGGTGANKKALDEEWEKQQEILANRRKPASERKAYFDKVEKRREDATKKQEDMWGWQTKQYKKGEDPINEWRKRRKDGTISDLENQYGDPKKIGGIPIPGASFGVGGEFGVGGKFDNGGRFDLRLPYADQGWVDEDEEGFKWPWERKEKKKDDPPPPPEPKKKNFWEF
ncbi:hypothetical protein TrRE_jg12896 [Triparma retinervis]|uniref:Uncharacterized protein n=1 Tax=Triparma retinervis TaxID=2557542 RepID=A0A9W7DLS2_9STRA|nr:hypothetical protein TrRE_jg12896 [Triparma retinervis]